MALWTLASLALVAVGGGCTTARPTGLFSTPERQVPADVRRDIGSVAIVPAQYAPESNLDDFLEGKAAAAAKGAVTYGAVGGAGWGAVGALTGAGPFVLFLAPFVIAIEASTGAYLEGRRALPREQGEEVHDMLARALARLDIQRGLATRLSAVMASSTAVQLRNVDVAGPASVEEAPAYGSLRTRNGADTVIEIAMRSVTFDPCSRERWWASELEGSCLAGPQQALLRLRAVAAVRVVRVSDAATLYAQQFEYAGPHRTLEQWLAEDASRLAAEFAQAYDDLARQIVDEVLLRAPLPPQDAWDWTRIHGLAPVYPPLLPLRVEFSNCITARPFGTVDSLLPTLRWSAFPRDADRAYLGPAFEHVAGVSYEVRIWEVEGCAERGLLVYERTGLPLPEHRLEHPLAPGRQYFWSFRGRFFLDGQPSVTPWAAFGPVGLGARFPFRFATPGR